MSGEVIKEFLVSLGYEQKGREGFVKGIAGATAEVVKLAAAIKAASLAVVAGVAKISSSMEDLYYASQRTGATVAQINALSFAASQMGSSADGARSSLEGLAQRMRTNPGYGGLVRSLVGNNVDLNNAASVMDRLAVRFREMSSQGPGGYAVAYNYAQALGIDENTMRAMIAGMDRFNADYRRRLQVFNLDTEAAARAGNAFMQTLRTTRSNAEILMQRITLALAPSLSQDIAKFNQFLEDNGKEIEEVILLLARTLLDASRFIGRAITVMGEFFRELYRWYRELPPQTQEFIRTLLAIIAAWKLLNLAFLTSPIGALLAFSAALVALWQDYQTWKDGGESLIDWSEWEPAINATIEALRTIGRLLNDGIGAIGGWQTAFSLLLAYVAGTWAIRMVGAIGRVAGALAGMGAGGAAGAAASRGLLARFGPAGAFLAAMWPTAANAGEGEELARITSDPEAMRRNRTSNGLNAPPSSPSMASRLGGWLGFGDPASRQRGERQEQHQTRLERLIEEGNNTTSDFMDAVRELLGMAPSARGGGGMPAPGAAGMGPSTPHTTEERRQLARTAYDFFVGRGLSPEQAAGIVSNLHHESGMRTNAVGDGGRAYGLAQWHPDRQAAFQRRFGMPIQEANFQQQLEFVWHEMFEGNERPAGAALRGARTAGEAGSIVSRLYERPRNVWTEAIRRGGQAQYWLQQFQGVPGYRSPASTPMAGAGGPLAGLLPMSISDLPAGITPQTRLGTTGAGGVTINQQTHIQVNGSGQPESTARAIAGEQNRVNADLARNAQGAIR